MKYKKGMKGCDSFYDSAHSGSASQGKVSGRQKFYESTHGNRSATQSKVTGRQKFKVAGQTTKTTSNRT